MPKLVTRYALPEKEFERFFKEYFRLALLISIRITDDIIASEDIVQEVFIGLWEKSDIKLADPGAKSYLLKSVKNKSLNFVRDKKDFVGFEPKVFEQADEDYDFNKEEKITKALAEVENLPPKCKEIFNLVVFKELKYSEVADQLNISVNTVKTQLGIAYRQLRKFHMIFFLNAFHPF